MSLTDPRPQPRAPRAPAAAAPPDDRHRRRRSSTWSACRRRCRWRPTPGSGRGLQDFDPAELSRMTEDREAVRGTLMRWTVHLVTADDFLVLRPVMQDMVERGYASSPFAPQIQGVDLDELLAAGRTLVEERATDDRRPARGARAALAGRRRRVARATRSATTLPLVQLPPRGLWPTRKGAARARGHDRRALARPPARRADAPTTTILRYLAAFGPATVPTSRPGRASPAVREVGRAHSPAAAHARDDRRPRAARRPGRPAARPRRRPRRRASSRRSTTSCSPTRTARASSPTRPRPRRPRASARRCCSSTASSAAPGSSTTTASGRRRAIR